MPKLIVKQAREAGVTSEIEAAVLAYERQRGGPAATAGLASRVFAALINCGGVDGVRAMSKGDLLRVKNVGRRTAQALSDLGLCRGLCRIEPSSTLEVSVLDIKPHPDQAEHNPGCWGVQIRIARGGKARSFWRWHTVRALTPSGFYAKPSNDVKPTADEILGCFWDDTFANLHGFDFQEHEA